MFPKSNIPYLRILNVQNKKNVCSQITMNLETIQVMFIEKKMILCNCRIFSILIFFQYPKIISELLSIKQERALSV